MDEIKIIKYLDGEMSPEERSAFEEEVNKNPSLAEELERYRQIQELAEKLLGDEGDEDVTGKIPGQEDISLDPAIEKEVSDAVSKYKKDPASFESVPEGYRNNLDAARKDYFDSRDQGASGEKNDSPGPEDPGGSDDSNRVSDPEGSYAPIPVIRKIWFRAAAIIILAVILSILIFKPFSEGTPDELYARYNRPFQKTEQVMEIARNDNDFLFAVEVFEAGDYERAIVLFGMLADSSQFRNWSLLYTGNSYMSMNRSAEAIELFKKVIQAGDADVLPHARWQLALSYLKTGNPEKAREQLEILAEDSVYRKDARRILRIVY